MLLGQLIEGTDIRPSGSADLSLRICDISEDSRTVVPGSLFVARRGVKSDGAAFIEQAIEAGADAILTGPDTARPGGAGAVAWLTADDIPATLAQIAERFFGRPSDSLRLVGVTGTNGKTTVAHFVQQLLNTGRHACGLMSTVQIDDGIEVADASLTTPSAIEISHTLRNMVDSGYASAAIEVSSHALVQQRAGALRFDIGIFTNITGEHLDYHGTMEEYARAKSLLFSQVRPFGCAILNADDPRSASMLRDFTGSKVLRTTIRDAPGADCRATIASARGPSATLETEVIFEGPWGTIRGVLPMFGEHNVSNALQAVAAASELGVPRPSIEAALGQLRLPPGRLHPVLPRDGRIPSFTVLVDYAHTDDALEKTLTAARAIVPAGASLRVAFGCGGDRDRAKRPRSAAVVSRFADSIVVTVNDAHTESPSRIIADILEGVPAEMRDRVTVHADRRQAIEHAIRGAEPGDVVVIAGKGHERVQYLPDGEGGETRVDFDDRIVAQEAIERRMNEEPRPAAGIGQA